MEKLLFQLIKMIKNKKAVSEIVSYTLLIIIAVGLSVAVYSFLKIYVPKDRLNCPDDISIIAQKITCNIDSSSLVLLSLNIKNKGLFNVTDLYIRVGVPGRTVRSQINSMQTPINNLPPGADMNIAYSSTNSSGLARAIQGPGKYILEIEPAIRTKNGTALCNNAVVTEEIECKASP